MKRFGVVLWGLLLVMPYLAYGQTKIPFSAYNNQFLFQGQRFDPELGMYRMGAREYNPRRGTWTQADPIGLGGGQNLYRFVNARPTTLADPSGLDGGNNQPATISQGPLPTDADIDRELAARHQRVVVRRADYNWSLGSCQYGDCSIANGMKAMSDRLFGPAEEGIGDIKQGVNRSLAGDPNGAEDVLRGIAGVLITLNTVSNLPSRVPARGVAPQSGPNFRTLSPEELAQVDINGGPTRSVYSARGAGPGNRAGPEGSGLDARPEGSASTARERFVQQGGADGNVLAKNINTLQNATSAYRSLWRTKPAFELKVKVAPDGTITSARLTNDFTHRGTARNVEISVTPSSEGARYSITTDHPAAWLRGGGVDQMGINAIEATLEWLNGL